jgi:hypothetical protein
MRGEGGERERKEAGRKKRYYFILSLWLYLADEVPIWRELHVSIAMLKPPLLYRTLFF